MTDSSQEPWLAYPALLTDEGSRTLVEFPDCPGCQTFVEEGDDILTRGREAIEGWLESCLKDGQTPPEPSMSYTPPEGSGISWITVSPSLMHRVAAHWDSHA
jgi:predicted RNase H-like HicB family nuclease